MMTDDPFSGPVRRCPECGATEGHYIACSILADEVESRKAVCPACFVVRPCFCEQSR